MGPALRAHLCTCHCRAFQDLSAGGIALGRIKPLHRIKKSLCTREDAVTTQVWCAASLLTAIVKDRRKLKSWLYTCPQIFSVSFARKAAVSCSLPADGEQNQPTSFSAPLILCDLWPDGGVSYAFFPAGGLHRKDNRLAGCWQSEARIEPGF